MIEVLPIHPVPRPHGELTQERAQAARVSLPEWMDRVHLRVVMRQSLQERFAIETDQVSLLRQFDEDSLRVVGDVLRARVERIWLGDLDGTQLTRPWVQSTEDTAVKRLPMRQGIATGADALARD